MPISLNLGETKSNISLNNEEKISQNLTWDEATMTWDESEPSTWDFQGLGLSKESKSNISLNNESKI